jgi:Leucine-rich repeat (LRR) protein
VFFHFQVPSKALSSLQKLIVLDFEANEITEIFDNSFYGLHLVKLNLKGNSLETLPELTFTGLEESLAEVDLSENKLAWFPIVPLIKMENLRLLRLSVNKITSIQQDLPAQYFTSLVFLDLSSNYLESLGIDYFRYFPIVKTLTLFNNYIESISRTCFFSLRELTSLDMSHNGNVFFIEK